MFIVGSRRVETFGCDLVFAILSRMCDNRGKKKKTDVPLAGRRLSAAVSHTCRVTWMI